MGGSSSLSQCWKKCLLKAVSLGRWNFESKWVVIPGFHYGWVTNIKFKMLFLADVDFLVDNFMHHG